MHTYIHTYLGSYIGTCIQETHTRLHIAEVTAEAGHINHITHLKHFISYFESH